MGKLFAFVFVRLWRRLLNIVAKFFSCSLIFARDTPRLALRCVLQKYGVPDCLVDLLHSFHDGMAATVSVGGEDATPLEVKPSRLHYCSNLYFEEVFQCWLHRCDKVLYKIGLIGERTRRPSSFIISECLFADDVALICASRSDMVIAARVFEQVTGLTLSIPKMKLLVAGANLTANDIAPFELGGGSVKVAKEFKYLGSLWWVSGEVNRRITQASKFFGHLRSSMFLAGDLGLETKRLVYQYVVLGSHTSDCSEARDFPSSQC